MGWQVETQRGTVAQLHDAQPDLGRRQAWWMEPTGPALALGSAQSLDTVDAAAAEALGLPVVRRRSGGGAVLVHPGEMAWLDVVVPRGDPWWDDDIGRSMWWLGEVWVAALADLGVAGEVYRGPMRHGPWSSAVCFAGWGSGEVVAGERKLVGISQRRTRAGARLQSMCHLVVRSDLYSQVIVGGPTVGDLDAAIAAVDVDADALRARLADHLAQR